MTLGLSLSEIHRKEHDYVTLIWRCAQCSPVVGGPECLIYQHACCKGSLGNTRHQCDYHRMKAARTLMVFIWKINEHLR